MIRRGLLLAAVFTLFAQSLRVQLVPGVTTTLRRPPSERETFLVSASAGQTLLVELNIDKTRLPDGASQDRIQVSPETAGPSVSPFGEQDAWQNWINVLPRSGAWRVTVYSPERLPHDVRMTLLDPHDPRLDPGIAADGVSLRGPHGTMNWSLKPFMPVVLSPVEFGPAHLEARDGEYWARIMAVDGFKKTWWMDGGGEKRVVRLQSALRSRTFMVSPQLFPSGATDVADLTFIARRSLLAGKSVRAIRWIGAYSQMGEGVPVNPLVYAADGITSDGRFLVLVRATVSHPAVPKDIMDLEGAKLQAFLARLSHLLEAASPDSFEPSLTHLDAMIESLGIVQPAH